MTKTNFNLFIIRISGLSYDKYKNFSAKKGDYMVYCGGRFTIFMPTNVDYAGNFLLLSKSL